MIQSKEDTTRLIRVLFADSQPIVRVGIRTVLGAAADIELVGEAGDHAQLQNLACQLQPDVLLLDIGMFEVPVAEALGELRARCASGRVLALSTQDHVQEIHALVRVGISGFVLKYEAPATLLAAVRLVADGGTYFSPPALERLRQPPLETPDPGVDVDTLTRRERQVLGMIADGWSNARIARQLCLSPQTVRNYASRIYGKLGVTARSEAVVAALKCDTHLSGPSDKFKRLGARGRRHQSGGAGGVACDPKRKDADGHSSTRYRHELPGRHRSRFRNGGPSEPASARSFTTARSGFK